MNTNSILEDIRSTPLRRKRAVKALLDNELFFASLRKYILNNQGTVDEAKMVFHDTIIAFTSYVFKNKNFGLMTSIEAYLMGMAKNLWITNLRKKKRQVVIGGNLDTDEKIDPEPMIDYLLIKGEKAKLLHQVLEQMKIRCKQVLMYWAGGYNMTEIAGLLGYKTEGVARKKKSECMKELYAYLGQNPDIKQQLKSI